jgi:hypothetical protein
MRVWTAARAAAVASVLSAMPAHAQGPAPVPPPAPQVLPVGEPDFWARTVSAAGTAVDWAVWPFRATWDAMGRAWTGAGDAVSAAMPSASGIFGTDFKRLESLVQRTGFKVSSVTVTPAPIPSLTLTFAPQRRITEAEAAGLRADIDKLDGVGGAVERAVIRALLGVEDTVSSIRPAGFRIESVSMALVTIVPVVSVTFAPDE